MDASPQLGDRCPCCFVQLPGGHPCPSCVRNGSSHDSPLVLPVGTLLAGNYRVGQVLGQPGGFGITYLAWDEKLETRVAIKEFFPRELAGRGTGRLMLEPHTRRDASLFEYGLKQFLQEARTLARFDHPNIVRVRSFFEANGTGYLVMDYYEGQSLAAYLAQQPNNRIEERLAVKIMLPVLDGLRVVHDMGILHRDIDPNNIYLTSQGKVILLDFGAARMAVGDRSRSLSVILKPGYAPYEQYASSGKQGPWTDVYACAATLYRMVSGAAPVDAPSRVIGDTHPVTHEANPAVSPRLSAVLERGLAVGVEERIQTAEEFRKALLTERSAPPPPPPVRPGRWQRFSMVGVGLLCASLLGGWLIFGGTDPDRTTDQAVAAYEAGDYTLALSLFDEAATRGDLEAQAYLGHMYYSGEGVEQDRHRALALILAPAREGHSRAQVLLGALYGDGEVVEQDFVVAAEWLERAAAQGEEWAQRRLALYYYNGQGVEQDHARTAELIRGPAEAGHGPSQYLLGVLYWNGQGVAQDLAQAAEWWYSAAEQGVEEARTFVLGEWAYDPLIPGAWQALDRSERRAELDRLRAEQDDRVPQRQVMRMRRTDVSFYDDTALYEVEVSRGGSSTGVVTYLRTGRGTVSVHGDVEPIHQLNRDAPLRIGSLEQAIDYLRFFSAGIQGEGGRFNLIDEEEDLRWRSAATNAQRSSARGHIRALVVRPSPSGGWEATGTVEYDRTLFSVTYHVPVDGTVTMTDDVPVASDLAIVTDRFGEDGVRVVLDQ